MEPKRNKYPLARKLKCMSRVQNLFKKKVQRSRKNKTETAPIDTIHQVKSANAEQLPSTSTSDAGGTCDAEPFLMEVTSEPVPFKKRPKPRKPKFEVPVVPAAPDTGKRQSGRIYNIKEEKKKNEAARRAAEKEAARKEKNKKIEQMREKDKSKNEKLNYMSFIADLSLEYLELNGKKQRMFRQAAIMFLNEMLDEQEAEASL